MDKAGKLFFFFIIQLINLVAMPANSQDVPVKREDFFFTLRDGVKLDCTKFVPAAEDTNRPEAGWPVIIYCHGYADSKDVEIPAAYAQSLYGYYTFTYSMRGQGNSEGFSNLISLTEMDDLNEIVKYIKNDKSTILDTSRIAIMGSSQGGIIPYMAVCNGLNVRTVLSDLASPEFASSWFENGCIKMTLFWSVNYDSTSVRYSNEVIRMRNLMVSPATKAWDTLAQLMPKNRDFADKLKNCNIPVLLSNAWQDEFFNATGNINASSVLQAPYRLYLGAIDGHGSDTTLDENNFLSDYESDWLDYWLSDEPNHITDSAKFIYASSHFPLNNNMWDFSHFTSDKWPPENITPVKLYFHANHLLSLNPANTSSDTLSFDNKVLDTTYTLMDAIDDEFSGPDYYSAFRKDFIGFETTPLKQPMKMTGVPNVDFIYSSDARVCQFNFQIWEVDPGDKAHLVTRINYTNRKYTPNIIMESQVSGLAHSHIFQQGNKIRIVITNLDTQPADSFLTTNPFVLPVWENAHNLLYMSKKYPSYIEFPVQDAGPNDVLYEPKETEQNDFEVYPNPIINNATVYSNITEPGNYSLEIYDLTGNLLNVTNSFLGDGVNSMNINTTNLPQGIYFMKLSCPKSYLVKTVIKN